MKFESYIKIVINQQILTKLKTCVKNARPNEACGLIFGDIKQVQSPDSEVYEIYYIGKQFNCIESNKKSPVAFLINDIEKLNSIFKEAAQHYNLRMVSIFHSHPSGAHPSGTDHGNMEYLDDCGNKAFKNQIWTIMSARSFKLNGFIYFNKELMQVDVKILD
ncbi:MAG: Mov34/MPN/PAD-1 family protein [Promethearchaeota archaeon]